MKVTMMHCYIPGCSPPAQAWHCQTCWRKGRQRTLPRQPGGELLGFWEWWIWWPAIQYKARCSCFPPKASKQQTPRSPPQALSIVIVIMTTILENYLGDDEWWWWYLRIAQVTKPKMAERETQVTTYLFNLEIMNMQWSNHDNIEIVHNHIIFHNHHLMPELNYRIKSQSCRFETLSLWFQFHPQALICYPSIAKNLPARNLMEIIIIFFFTKKWWWRWLCLHCQFLLPSFLQTEPPLLL